MDLFFRSKYIFGNVLKVNPQIGRYYAPPAPEVTQSPKALVPANWPHISNQTLLIILWKKFSGEILKGIHEEIKKRGIIEGLDTLEYKLVAVDRQRLFTRFYVTYDEMAIVDRHLEQV